MSSVTIDYDKLNSISKNANNAASRMNDYINDLTNKVTSKYSSITGGSSSKTQNSAYYVNQKISQLRAKKENYKSFANAVSKFSSEAQEIDKDVARKIKASKDQFIKKHDYIKTDVWTDIRNWFIDLKNSCPLFNAIGQMIEDTITGMKNLFADLKHWYKCGGGKELVGVILAVAGAVAAVVIAICACVPPICGIVAICAAIGAVIAAVNAIVNVVTSIKAKKAKDNGDPAWAKIYGDQDTAQDVLRQTNFGDGTLNRLSYGAATTIDVVQTVCDVVAIYDGIKNVRNIYKEIKVSAQKGKVSFGTRFKQYLFNSDSYLKNDKGKALKWRDILQKRGKTYTQGTQLTNTVKKYAKHVQNGVKYTQRFFDYTLGGEGSMYKVGKDIFEGIAKKFKLPDTALKIRDLKIKNLESFKKDYRGTHILKGV